MVRKVSFKQMLEQKLRKWMSPVFASSSKDSETKEEIDSKTVETIIESIAGVSDEVWNSSVEFINFPPSLRYFYFFRIYA